MRKRIRILKKELKENDPNPKKEPEKKLEPAKYITVFSIKEKKVFCIDEESDGFSLFKEGNYVLWLSLKDYKWNFGPLIRYLTPIFDRVDISCGEETQKVGFQVFFLKITNLEKEV
ncbi:MAG: hypothetical protein ACOXZY_00075 [Patescibacteria group bacterium]|nr:hypothetical protein [Candidatus Magasanikbacteria bacterium]